MVALLNDLSDECAEVGSGRQELGCREMVGGGVTLVQLRGRSLDQAETTGAEGGRER